MLAHPTLDLLASLGLHGMAKGFQDLEAQPEARALRACRMARPAARPRGDAAPAKALRKPRPRRSAAPSGQRRGCRLPRCPRPRPRRSSSSSPAATGSAPGMGCCSPDRPASARAGSPARSATRPAGRISRVAYHRAPRLFAALALARGDGRYTKMLRGLARVDLLILDDWGPEKLDDEQRRDLLEIVEDRHERRSTIVTSQLPVDRWYEIIGNPTIADAVLDRLVAQRLSHRARRREPAQTPLDGSQTMPAWWCESRLVRVPSWCSRRSCSRRPGRSP